jgi:hypothetical protein
MDPSPANTERDGVARILDALRVLASNAPSPVIRLCLEEARKDIAHLAGAGDEYQDAAGRLETTTPSRGEQRHEGNVQ